MSAPQEQWPIVGGEYRAADDARVTAEVYHIEDERVFYTIVARVGSAVSRISSSLSLRSFREEYLPEDQSPIPALVAALERCVAVFELLEDEGNYPTPLYDNGGWQFALDAIAAARIGG